MRIPPDARAAYRRRSLEVWNELLATAGRPRTEGGRHPTDPELAEVILYHGTPTAAARAYVASRTRGDHPLRDAGRPPATARDQQAPRRNALRLHEAVEHRRAAFDLQGIQGSKKRALEAVSRIAGTKYSSLSRRLKSYLQDARANDWPIVVEEDAKARVRASVEAGLIRLDPVEGWELTPEGRAAADRTAAAWRDRPHTKGGHKK